MNELQAIEKRHSVRKYLETPIPSEVRMELDRFTAQLNAESGLNITIQYDEPVGFDSKLAHYGSFRNVFNYIVLKGVDCPGFEERCGYYGEKLVIKAQMLGLNTCWAALTFNKNMVKKLIPAKEKLCMVIALGYGENEGRPHKSKFYDEVVATHGSTPVWFYEGVTAALLAPTAMNQQKFRIGISAKSKKPAIVVNGSGICTEVDLGIVEYHFEVGSGVRVFKGGVEPVKYTMSAFLLKYFGRYCDLYLPGEKEKITKEAQVHFDRLMHNAPDMGDKGNMMASNLDMTAAFFAFYEASDHRIGGEAIDELINWLADDYAWAGRFLNMKLPYVRPIYYKIYANHAKAVKSHKAKGEWMGTWDIEINPEHKKEGIAYHMSNCPLLSFAKMNGYEDMMPYICRFDYIFERFLHAKLIRTRTEATGGDCCDYWFVRQ